MDYFDFWYGFAAGAMGVVALYGMYKLLKAR